ncbi:MAG: 2OG-Fe(II) oxygenase [Pseudomonadota bacterium]
MVSPAAALDLDAFRRAPLKREPCDYLILPGVVRQPALDEILDAYPDIDRPGSFPSATLRYGPRFAAFLDEIEGPEFRAAVAEKFGVDLEGRPTLVTVRGRCRASDGKIHTDTDSKIITVLFYFNRDWEPDGGRLRILMSPTDLDAVADEVPPIAGTVLAFRRSARSWHGHKPFEGPRRAVQLNWVTDQRIVDRELARHRLSAWVKRLNPLARG